MGSTGSVLDEAIHRAQDRVGRISVEGRYHNLPRRLTNDYRLEAGVVRSGCTGPVLLATSRRTGLRCTVKHFRLSGTDRERAGELAREAEVFLSLDHPHIARLLEVYKSEDHVSLVMECMEGGELFDRVHEQRVFSEQDAAQASWQMLLAINYIHGAGIVHRDIKLQNFSYEKLGSDFLKLTDFGFSKFCSGHTRMEHSCGTVAYVAPEVLAKSYTSLCDMWSFGVIVFVLLMGHMPFSGRSSSEIIRAIRTGAYVLHRGRWARVSHHARDFLRRILVVKPRKRLTAEQALRHPWIARNGRLTGCTSDRAAGGSFDEEVANSLRRFARGSKFRRACMQMMAWCLTLEEQSKLRGVFFELDKECKGTVTLGMLKQVLEEKINLPESESLLVLEALKDLDYDHDEEVHYSELLAATMSSRIAMHDRLLEATFCRFDTENSGYITPKNLRQVLGKHVDVGTVVGELDEDHDGKITFMDFVAYLRSTSVEGAHLEVASQIVDKGFSAGCSSRITSMVKRVRAKVEAPLLRLAAANCYFKWRGCFAR